MHIQDLFARHKTTFSFEFFPPKTPEAAEQVFARATELAELKPAFVSVTYGAGGSTRERTHQLVVRLHRELGMDVMPHLTCVGSSRDELSQILEQYRAEGIDNIMALRGDPPQEGQFEPHPEGLRYANELVAMIKEAGHFGIGVAGYPEGHPETPNKLADLENLRRKVDAGADFITTQLFFDNRDFYDFRERCDLVGIRVPIIAGIMPVLSRKGIERMAGLCGSRLPAQLLRQLWEAGDEEEVAKIGTEWAANQCRDLLANGVRGIHFYTLNRSKTTFEIYRQLGASDSPSLEEIASS